jgi:hypothetical protein
MTDLSNPLGQVFGLMPPETQEAMKKARADGARIERFDTQWVWNQTDAFWKHIAYRVKPAPIRETVTLSGCHGMGWGFWRFGLLGEPTHRIQFDLIDGKPDCASIKMEPLE